MKNIFKMFRYIPGEKLRIVGLILFSIFGGLVNTVLPLLFRSLINNISASINQNNFTKIYIFLVIILIVLLVDQIIGYFKEKVSDVFRMQITTKMRLAIYPKLLSLDVSYTEKHQPGAILQKINQGVGGFAQWIFSLSEWAGTLITSTIFILVVLWMQNIWLGVVFSITIPIMIFISIKKAQVQKPYMKKANRYMEAFSGTMSETLSHFETIKSSSAEKITTKKFQGLNTKLKNARLQQFKIQRNYNFLRDFIGTIGISVALIITIYLITKKAFGAGDILLIALYSRTLTSSISPLGYFIQDSSEVNYTSARLLDFLEIQSEFTDSPDAVPLKQMESIEFKNVSFDYIDGKKGAVKNVSFEISPGKTIALVGPSGVGKSTLTKLFLRFYRPTNGSININGQPVENYTQDSIRQHIGVVMQDIALFNSTILENLQIANANATEEQIMNAAKQAHAHEFIQDLPKGYKTLVGERGIKLSGGQKQRIAIARAILKNPQLIILDEATSALDSQSEHLVQDGLKKLMQGRSALVIAHRLSTVQHADEILVLEKGTIIERGTHQELITISGGLYKKLFEMQSASGKIQL
ncbi:ABC transporter ATP-binding protein [Candidatus Saccharibacteria bacterium]|nr:ABC transporter ATP-binding protein [Candidatus Saccharibacteria bacterium]